MFMKYLKILGVLIIILALSGCAPKINVMVMRPAEVNLAKYKKIAVGEITADSNIDRSCGNQGDNVTEELTQALFQTKRFDVLDRQKLKRVLEEQHFSASDYTNPDTAVQMGKILGPSALIFGRVGDAHFNETLDRNSYTDTNGGYHTSYTRKGEARMDVFFQLTDLTTGQIIATKKIGHSDIGKIDTTDREPPHIDPASHYANCRNVIIREFMKVIAPWKESVQVHFKKYTKYSEMEQGINYCKIGEWEKAKGCFKQALDKAESDPKVSQKASKMSKIHYNYGLTFLYTNQFSEAKSHFETAWTLGAEPLFQELLNETNRRAAEYQKLKEQNAVCE